MGKFDFEAAVKAFDPIVEKYPTWKTARLNRGIALLNRSRPDTKDLDRALDIMLEIQQEDPEDLRARHCAGLILLYRGKIDAARPFFEFVATRDETDPYSAFFVGDCYRQSDEVEKAIAWFEKARERDPSLRSAYHALFQALRWEGREDEAQEMFAIFQKLATNPQARVAEIKYTRMGRHGMVRAVDLPGATPPPRGEGPLFEDPTLLPLTNGEGLTWVANAEDASVAAVDLDGDGATDLFFTGVLHGDAPNLVALRRGESFDVVLDHPLATVPGVGAALFGDIDNDGRTDACLCRTEGDRIFRNTESAWTDVTDSAWAKAPTRGSIDGALVDIDHDGDLDLFLLQGRTGFRAWFNTGTGVFDELPADAGLVSDGRPAEGLVLGDFDQDRDLDVLVLSPAGGHQVFVNDRLWNWRSDPAFDALCQAPALSGLCFDRDADGQAEIYLAGPETLLRWQPGADGTWQAEEILRHAGAVPAPRLGVLDADGDARLDLLLTDGSGARVLPAEGAPFGDAGARVATNTLAIPYCWSAGAGPALVGIAPSGTPIVWKPGPGRHGFAALTLSGLHKEADSMRSNASGIGTRLAVRVDSRWTVRQTYRVCSGPGQSHQPLCVGLVGEPRIDFVDLLWTDGLVQTEDNLAPGEVHRITETQRQTSSCPVLFAWDGSKFAFLSDVLGVGGVGFWVAPGTYAPPAPQESFLLPPGSLAPKDGAYVLKLGEPMEEGCYLDAAELRAYDLPPGWDVTIDERMHIAGPAPTGDVLFFRKRAMPVRATDAAGRDVRAALLHADRKAVDVEHIDRRYIGRTTREHVVTLVFDAPIDHGSPVLVTDGWIEYPYAQTMFAAWQAQASYDAPTIEARAPGGAWRVVLETYGYPAGMPRQSSVPLPNLPKGTTELRLRTNQEVYWDRLFVAFPEEVESLVVHDLGSTEARLLDAGFALRTTGPQRLPHYDHARRAPLWDTRHQAGWYTRFGDVYELIAETDDAVVIFGPGEEVELRFPIVEDPLEEGWSRHFVFRSTGWCKDMDLFTKDGETVGPLPTRAENGKAHPARARLHPEFQTRYQSGR